MKKYFFRIGVLLIYTGFWQYFANLTWKKAETNFRPFPAYAVFFMGAFLLGILVFFLTNDKLHLAFSKNILAILLLNTVCIGLIFIFSFVFYPGFLVKALPFFLSENPILLEVLFAAEGYLVFRCFLKSNNSQRFKKG